MAQGRIDRLSFDTTRTKRGQKVDCTGSGFRCLQTGLDNAERIGRKRYKSCHKHVTTRMASGPLQLNEKPSIAYCRFDTRFTLWKMDHTWSERKHRCGVLPM